MISLLSIPHRVFCQPSTSKGAVTIDKICRYTLAVRGLSKRHARHSASPRNEKADRELNRSRHYGCVRLKWQLRTRQVADKVAVSAPPLWLWRLAVVSGLVPSIPVFRSVRD